MIDDYCMYLLDGVALFVIRAIYFKHLIWDYHIIIADDIFILLPTHITFFNRVSTHSPLFELGTLQYTKYACANGSVSAGSAVQTIPSASTV